MFIGDVIEFFVEALWFIAVVLAVVAAEAIFLYLLILALIKAPSRK